MNQKDRLQQMWDLQARLNLKLGYATEVEFNEPNDYRAAGIMIRDYVQAMSSEMQELMDCMYWKHWSQEAQDGFRFQIHDLDNAKLECVDMFHFMLSICQCVGLTTNDLFNLYTMKHQLNEKRQETAYNHVKTDDNDNIQLMNEFNEINEMKYYITFGQAHKHQIEDLVFDKDCYAGIKCKSLAEAHDIAMKLFDGKFHQALTKAEASANAHYFPRGTVNIPNYLVDKILVHDDNNT